MSDKLGQPILKVAAKAVITNPQGEVLLVRENAIPTNSQAGQYGIVGGKLEDGESFFDALAREAREETGLTVEPIKPIFVGEWYPTVLGRRYHIVATFFWCKASTSQVTLSDEHDDFIWIKPQDYHDYPVMDPDPQVLEQLMKELKAL